MSIWDPWDAVDDEGSSFCVCGVTIPYGTDECEICAAAPHDRECMCDECDAYWTRIEAESRAAAERWRARRKPEPVRSEAVQATRGTEASGG